MSSECYTKYLPDDRKIHVEFFKNLNQNSSLESPTKGQIKPKADWRAIDSPKKRTNEFFFFAKTVRKFLKLEIKISSLNYFQTFMAKRQKQIRPFVFWENLWRTNLLLVLSDLY